MKISFVGTSHGRPELGRSISGTLFEVNGEYYIFDAGTHVNAYMINTGKDVRKIRSVFISHMHCDHICALPALIDDIDSYRKADKEVMCFLPEDSSEKALFDWMSALHMNPEVIRETFKFSTVKTGLFYKDENIEVIARPTRHLEKFGCPSYAFEIHAEGKTVLFSGDMQPRFPEYDEVVGSKHYDLVICEMGHARLAVASEFIKNTDTERMIFNHIYPKQLLDSDGVLETYPFKAEIATDGLEVTI